MSDKFAKGNCNCNRNCTTSNNSVRSLTVSEDMLRKRAREDCRGLLSCSVDSDSWRANGGGNSDVRNSKGVLCSITTHVMYFTEYVNQELVLCNQYVRAAAAQFNNYLQLQENNLFPQMHHYIKYLNNILKYITCSQKLAGKWLNLPHVGKLKSTKKKLKQKIKTAK